MVSKFSCSILITKFYPQNQPEHGDIVNKLRLHHCFWFFWYKSPYYSMSFKNLHNSNNVSQYLIKHKTHLNYIVQIQQDFPFFGFSSYMHVIHGNTVSLFLSWSTKGEIVHGVLLPNPPLFLYLPNFHVVPPRPCAICYTLVISNIQ